MANVTENGEVSIDDQFIGRLEGFRFRLDPSADAEQAKTLRQAGVAALAPALSLRADKFYNAPDPEIDVTEQGGLMWGEYAVGKLIPGPDALSPGVQPFVDEDAGPEIAEKVRRRLGHWIDRRIVALFQPLIAMRDDETLTGMARGVAFRLVEALGVLPRAEIADDVKGLDQEGRASLRKHGVRFGQYTVFQPLMLKPAPTRLRLVLWALKEGLDEFPSAPPPGLVTVPAPKDAPPGYFARAGYRLAGERMIRIDMLERLADMIRGLDAQAGFEAGPDMLSITGLSQEQFAKLMQGLGYVATLGTRPKRKPQPAAAEPATEASDSAPVDFAPAEDTSAAPAPEAASEPAAGPSPEAPAGTAAEPDAAAAEVPAPAEEGEPAPVEMESFYTFARAPRRRPDRAPREARKPREGERPRDGDRPRQAGGPRERAQPAEQDRPRAEGSRADEPRAEGPRADGPRNKRRREEEPRKDKGKPESPKPAARPVRPEKPIDPDNPFAALMALKIRG